MLLSTANYSGHLLRNIRRRQLCCSSTHREASNSNHYRPCWPLILQGLCCSQQGFCSRSPDACDGTCQCQYSGVGSRCKGSFPKLVPLHVPTATPGGACGSHVANCPNGQCCSQFGVCVDDGSVYCSKASCRANSSPGSARCAAVSFQSRQRRAAAVNIVRQTWVVTWQILTLDGFTRPVSCHQFACQFK